MFKRKTRRLSISGLFHGQHVTAQFLAALYARATCPLCVAMCAALERLCLGAIALIFAGQPGLSLGAGAVFGQAGRPASLLINHAPHGATGGEGARRLSFGRRLTDHS